MPENELRSRLVRARIVAKSHALERFLNRPSGKYFRHFGDVTLRVAAVHAERMQLKEFAPIVLVEAGILFAARVWIRREPARTSIRPVHRARWNALCLH